MGRTLEIAGQGPITLEDALEEEYNVISRLSYGPANEKLYRELWEERSSIEALTRHHLGLSKRDSCKVLPPASWIRGAFNVCVFVDVRRAVHHGSSERVVFRCPLPHKLAEARYPGSIDEKLSCEVGAHIWVEEHCPEIRTPHLFGFGFSDGRHFTHTRHVSFFVRTVHRFWRAVYQLFRFPLLSRFVRNPPRQSLSSAYMVLEYLGPETGQTLSKTFDAYRGDKPRRGRLFKGIARIMLSLARLPQPRIGSFQFHDDGTITLTNRPLSCSVMILENEGATRTMQSGETYNCTDAFVSDMLTFHDHRFLSQPNAVFDENDCYTQMAVKTLLRVLSHAHIKRELRNGPFPLQLTDLHASNIFVDDQWNVTGLIDLEWLCALPAEMLDVPYWLTGCAIDEIKGEKLAHFDEVRQEFMRIFEEEAQTAKSTTQAGHNLDLGKIMQDVWESKGVWFWHCLSSVNAMYLLLEAHFFPSLSLEADKLISKFWCQDPEDVVRKKLADKRAYDEELRSLFHNE
ncbi:uncharacterized protein THITE_2061567 [Thermothielavioides terrestris NRRL 8126]|uniref:Aminoglycoside phosphotransferase domain-containing protein n=1 Tax=Thermothielavioides terrestris (strain ATCC 38088 / NRRL 8126) TaxID=578455 RepID=G2QQK4_THETT|nr:uncharacterized protein THITE_2061567 [Thermothielavioides terrestris NRRL 8126]AEO62414.1 hypothetical protein THITE_2061567 [Thermothielavioides terrestris NRRL 8126]